MSNHHSNTLRIKSLGIDTYRENIIFMRSDCHICRSEGFTALTRLEVHQGEKSLVATLNVVHSKLLGHGEAALSLEAMRRLGASEGDEITVTHLRQVNSLGNVRAKIYGRQLSKQAFDDIIADVVAGRYSNIELAAFLTACAGEHLALDEITALTQAMIGAGKKLHWDNPLVLDKHCIGGLPGNRTTPIVVGIVAAVGLTIPKTSSRAITSPAGTADTMETLAPVELSLDAMQAVVRKEGGCIAWGGAVQLSPADDIFISVEKALDIDSEGQMIASVLSKKAAAGSTHVVIDIPVGDTAKVRTHADALKLQYYFAAVGEAIGLKIETIISDGNQPVGRGIGPALEALDVLAILKNEPSAPQDLKERAVTLAGVLLEMAGHSATGDGNRTALEILESGKAWEKFQAICAAQGGLRQPPRAPFTQAILAEKEGTITVVDNRRLARLAKLAGAPSSPAAGVFYEAPLGKTVFPGDTLFTLHAATKGELEYALEYFRSNGDLITIEPVQP